MCVKHIDNVNVKQKENKMKKLMIVAITAAMCNVGYSSACSEPEDVQVCRAWDVSMTLKTLAPNKTKCDSGSLCNDTSTVYYLDGKTRKVKGYIWICDYSCDDEPQFNCVLWDPDAKCALIAYPGSGDVQTVSASEVYAYGKKATKVCGTIGFTGVDATDDTGIDVVASGVNGKLQRPKNDSDCFIKTLSGTCSGTIKYVKPGTKSSTRGGTLCEEPEVIEAYEDVAKLIPFCSACCFDGWCEADDAPDMVPCTGTWKIKYNEKVSQGKKSIVQLIPSYAL